MARISVEATASRWGGAACPPLFQPQSGRNSSMLRWLTAGCAVTSRRGRVPAANWPTGLVVAQPQGPPFDGAADRRVLGPGHVELERLGLARWLNATEPLKGISHIELLNIPGRWWCDCSSMNRLGTSEIPLPGEIILNHHRQVRSGTRVREGQEKLVIASDVTGRMANRWTDMRVRNPADRRTITTLAAHSRWAAGPDRQAARRLTRRGLELRFARQADVDGIVRSWRSGSRTPGRRKWRG